MLVGICVAAAVVLIAAFLFSYDLDRKNKVNILPPNNVDDLLLYRKFKSIQKEWKDD